MSDARQKNQLELAFTGESRSEEVPPEGTETLTAQCWTQIATVALAEDPGTVVVEPIWRTR